MNQHCLVIDYYISSDLTLKSPISDDPRVSVILDSAFRAKEDVEFYKACTYIVSCYIITQAILCKILYVKS